MHCCSLRLVFLKKDSEVSTSLPLLSYKSSSMWLSMPQAICIAHPSSQDIAFWVWRWSSPFSGFDFFVTFFGRVLSFPTLFKDVFIFPHLFCRMFYFAAPFFGNVFFSLFFVPGFIDHCRRETTRALGSSTRLGPDATMWRCSTRINWISKNGRNESHHCRIILYVFPKAAAKGSFKKRAVFKDCHQTSPKVLLKWWLSWKIVIKHRPKFDWSDGCL